MFTVTRQIQWLDGDPVVEVSEGGMDYTNPDALSPVYSGEMEEYEDPIEAVEVAIGIVKDWRKDGEKKAKIGVGSTRGFTIPFEPDTFAYARAWAKKKYEQLEKCPVCSSIMEDAKEWYNAGFISKKGDFFPYNDGYKYCSERCAENASEFETEEE